MRTSTKNTMLSSTFSHQCDEFLMAARVCAIFSCVIFVHFPGLIDCASHLWDFFVGCAYRSNDRYPIFTKSLMCLLCWPHIPHISTVFMHFCLISLLCLYVFDVLMEEYISTL